MLSRLLTRKEQLVILAFAGSVALGAVALVIHHRRDAATVIVPERIEEQGALAVRDIESVPARLPEAHHAVPFEPPQESGPAWMNVAIRGAVHRPGVYQFEAGDRVEDGIRRAGGARRDADLSDINRAASLIDGTTLQVPVASTAHLAGNRLVVRGGNAGRVRNPPQYTISGWRGVAAQGRKGATQQASGEDASPAWTAPGVPINVNRASAEELESLPGIGPVLAEAIVQYRSGRPFASVEELTHVKGIGPKRLEAIRPLIAVE